MQLSVVLSVVFASILSVSALPGQGLDGLPSCATGCAVNGMSNTKCSMTDFKCICSDKNFLDTIQSCVTSACNSDEQQRTLQMSQQLCGAVGVTFTATLPAATGKPTATGNAAANASSTPATMPAQGNDAGRMAISVLGVIGVAGLAGALMV